MRGGRTPLAGRLAQVVETQTSIARAGLSPAAVLRLVAAQAKELTAADGVAILTVGGAAPGVVSASGSASALLASSHPVLDAIGRETVESGLPVVWPAVDAGLRCDSAIGSAAAVPVRQRERVVAVVVATAEAPAAFSAEDLQVLQLLAGLVGAAVAAGPSEGERRADAERLAHLSTHDALTLLPNRALFGDRLRHALTLARRHHTRLCVMVVDLVGFAALNERLGTAAGDHLLRTVADRLRSAVREPDTVARLGGDEFVLLLAGDVTPEAARVLEGRLQRALEQPILAGGHSVALRASVGAAFYPFDGDDADSLLQRAEAALLGTA